MVKVTIGTEELLLLKKLRITPYAGNVHSTFKIGDVLSARPGSTIESFTRHCPRMLSSMGAFSYVSENGPSIVKLTMGRYCSVAIGLRIMDGHHPLDAVTTSPYIYDDFFSERNIPKDYVYSGPRLPFAQSYGTVRMGHDVWVGSHCTILAGTKIGNGAVIAGGANVVKDVPPYAIVGGNPARVIRLRFAEEICARLSALKWWTVCPSVLRGCNMYDPENFCQNLERMLEEDRSIRRFAPDSITVTAEGKLV